MLQWQADHQKTRNGSKKKEKTVKIDGRSERIKQCGKKKEKKGGTVA